MSSETPLTFSQKMENLVPYIIMAAFILIVQVGSLWLSATEYIASQPPLDNPESVSWSAFYIVALVIFSLIIVFLIKRSKTFIIRGIIYLAISVTLYYVFTALLDKAVGLNFTIQIISVLAAIAFTFLLYKFPEWYIIDFAGLMISIGACAVIGVSLSYIPIIVLMIGLLIYDFISVYKTKHMLTLANGMMDLKLPILFVIPKKWSYSFVDENFSDDDEDEKKEKAETKGAGTASAADVAVAAATVAADTDAAADAAAGTAIDPAVEIQKKKKKSDALFMGLGDAVIPTLLVVSANRFIEHEGFISMPSLFTIVGTFVGFAVLMYVVSKGKPQAGLPFLNTGAIIGFAAGVVISGATLSLSLGF